LNDKRRKLAANLIWRVNGHQKSVAKPIITEKAILNRHKRACSTYQEKHWGGTP
jgi:hypothetical protein